MPALANAKHELVASPTSATPQKIGARAYRKVYPTCSQAAAEAAFSRLLRNAKFTARIAEFAEQVARGAVMAVQQMLLELSRLGRANMLDYILIGPSGDPVLDFSPLNPHHPPRLIQVIA